MRALSERLTDRKLISRGDISSAYRARDKSLDRDVFLKILHPHFAQDEELRARFEREARAAAKLDHQNLVRIYEVGEDPHEGAFMLLEWVEGETLAARLAREKTLHASQVRTLAAALLHALAALHEAGILHRDVKPENILCRRDGLFKLTDFSLALLSDAPKLTYHNAVVGTPAYLAPELARGKSPSERSDLFAVGVVLFEAATGINPFAADSLLESLRRVREEEPDWLLLSSLESDKALELLIRTCLTKEAGDRPATASNALILLAGEPSSANVQPVSRLRTYILPITAAVFSIVVVLILWPDGGRKKDVVPAIASKDSTAVSESTPDTSKTVNLQTSETESARKQEPVKTTESRKPDTAVSSKSAASTDSQSILPDSVDLFLDTFPWAHVSLNGVDLGTTPLGKSLRLPRGQHVFVLRNPAFPPIQANLELNANSRRQIKLAEYVQHVEVSVEPWGDIYLDNERIGTSPLNRLLTVLPGTHTLRITHTVLPQLEKSWQAAAGDTIRIHANLQTSELAIRTPGEKN